MTSQNLLVVTALALVGISACSTPAPPRFVIGVIATGPGEALLRSRGDDKPESDDFWLEPVDAGRSPRWRVALPVDAASAVGFGGLAVADTQVIVLGRGPDGAIARALDRATGEQQWSVALPKIAEPDARPEPSVVIDGPRALFLRGIAGQRATSIDAVALADGALLWTYHAGQFAEVRPLAPGRLLVTANHGSVVIDGATGDVGETLDGVDVLCPLADGVLLNQGGDAAILTAAPVRTLPAIDRLLVASEEWCGSRDGDVVVAMYPRDTSLESTAVRRAADTGQVRWTTPLGRRSLAKMVVVDGRLPRFLPVYLSGKFEDDARELAVLDLDDGRVVQRGAITERAQVFASAERAWVWVEDRGNLIAIDPATGAYAGATGFGAPSHAAEDVRFGELWLYSKKPGGHALPWATFDLATGKVLRHNGSITVGDASMEHRQLFEE